MNKLVLVGIGALVVGCVAPTDGADVTEDVAQSSAELNGTIKFDSNCTAAQQTTLKAAMAIAKKQILGDDQDRMLTCLVESQFSEQLSSFPERTMDELGQNMPTTIHCAQVTGGNGEASVGIDHEEITVDPDFIANACDGRCSPGVTDDARIASLILHELGHNKGYDHPVLTGGTQEYQYTVPEQIKMCSMAVFSNSVESLPRGDVPTSNASVRSKLPDRVEMHRFASGDGTEKQFGLDTCGDARFVRGLVLDANQTIDRISVRCDDRTPSGAIAATPARGVHQNGDTNQILDCPNGGIMVGVHGRASTFVNALAPICAKPTDVAASNLATTDVRVVGGTDGLAFRRVCPPGMAIKAFAGRVGDKPSQLSFVCQDWDDTTMPRFTQLATVGQQSTGVYQERCANGAMYSLFGQGEVNRVGGECASLDRDSSGNLERSGPKHSVVAAHGGTVGTNWSKDACPDGAALVGFDFRAQGTINSMRGVCADLDQWDTDAAHATITRLQKHGAFTDGTATTLLCPAGQFVTGWNTSYFDISSEAKKSFVSSLAPICRAF